MTKAEGRVRNSYPKRSARSLRTTQELFSVLAMRIKKVRMVVATFFIDDLKFRAKAEHEEQLIEVLDQSLLFDALAGQQQNMEKGHLVCANNKTASRLATKIDFAGDIGKRARSLGFGLNSSLQVDRAFPNKRVDKALETMRLVNSLPNVKTLKIKVIEAKVIPGITFSTEVSLPSDAKMIKLRTQILKAAFSNRRAQREPHMTMALLFRPHRIDPKSAVIYHISREIRKLWQAQGMYHHPHRHHYHFVSILLTLSMMLSPCL
jgi:hypothetical protein